MGVTGGVQEWTASRNTLTCVGYCLKVKRERGQLDTLGARNAEPGQGPITAAAPRSTRPPTALHSLAHTPSHSLTRSFARTLSTLLTLLVSSLPNLSFPLHPPFRTLSATLAIDTREADEPAMAPENPFESAFDDEFAVQDPLPADHGSRAADEPRDRAETRATTASQPRPSSDEPAVRRSTSLSPPSDAKRPVVQPPRLVQQRSSIAKNRDLFSPDQQRHSNRDRLSRAVADGTPRQSSDSPRRSSSRASSFAPYDRSGTPLNGPSHPYGMYPQTGVARTASVATSSTIRRPPSTPLPQSSPSHPYALYQQNSLPVSDDDSSVQPLPTIQIGFPGSNAEFHRQLGPDGEEQDIIGPDGHTEQLPPYSKYPNENEKAYVPMAVVPTSPTPSHESQNVLVPPSERQPSHNDRSPSESEGSGTTAAASEKSWKEKNWKERRKTRVCGVFPCWLVMVAFGCLTFVGVVLGGVIGGFLAKEKAKEYGIAPVPCMIGM